MGQYFLLAEECIRGELPLAVHAHEGHQRGARLRDHRLTVFLDVGIEGEHRDKDVTVLFGRDVGQFVADEVVATSVREGSDLPLTVVTAAIGASKEVCIGQ